MKHAHMSIMVTLVLIATLLGATSASAAWLTHVNNWWVSNSQITDPELSWPSGNYAAISTGGHTLKKIEMGIGYVSASAITVTGATPLACTGLSGVADAGATEGYVTMDSSADVLLFAVQMPPTSVVTGAAGDLVFEFDVDENGTDTTMVLTVTIYDGDSTTAIASDSVSIDTGTARGWFGLQTYAGGLGALSTVTVNDRFYIKVAPQGATDVCNIYGVRMKYRAGLEVTE